MPIRIELVFCTNFFETAAFIGFLEGLRRRGAEVSVEGPSAINSTKLSKIAQVSQMKLYIRRHPSKHVLGRRPLSRLVLHESKDNHFLIARQTLA